MEPRLYFQTTTSRTVVLEEEISGNLGVVSTDDRHGQFLGRRDVGDDFPLAGDASAQRVALSSLLEHGVRVARASLGRAASGRQRMREVDERDVESLARKRAEPPRRNVRPAFAL